MMKRRGSGSARQFSKQYLARRTTELASPATRSRTDPLAAWAVKRIRLEGVPFSFEGHAYLREIYDATAPHVVLSKAAQIGGTTWALLRSIHACQSGLNVIYFFPTRTDVLEFSKSRVGPLLADNPFLEKLMTETDTAGLKQIGQAHLFFRGMQSRVGMKSVPGDMLVFDELDETTPEAKSLAKERLAHSPYKRIIELSNPSIPGYGIDESYQQSDQRHWLMKCGACGDWTSLEKEFPKKLGEEVRIILPRKDGTFYRACLKCGAELDVDRGEWVADFPDRPIRGYRISQLFSSKVDPGEILKEYRTTRFPQSFYTMKIGVPYTDLESQLDIMSVLSLCTDTMMLEKSEEPCLMGVDTGNNLHVVILRDDPKDYETQHLVYLAICQDFSELDALIERFNVERCVIDAQPDMHSTRALAKRHSGTVYMSFFNEHQRGAANWDWKTQIVQVNRTEALDASRTAVREKKLVLPRRLPLVELFAKHMAADARVLDEDKETGAKTYRYIKVGGEDHFSFAFTYAWMASTDMSGGRGFIIYMRQEIEEQKRRP